MKKFLVILIGVLFLFACKQGKPVPDETSLYRKRADGYYYDLGIIYGAKKIDVDIDENSFEVLKGGYAKDKDHVFFKARRIGEADPATFEGLERNYGKDKDHVFYQSYRIEEADPETFKALTAFYGRDDGRVFCDYRLVVGADPDSFYVDEKGVLKDRNHIFIIDEAHDKYYPSTLNLDRDTVEYVEGEFGGRYVPFLKDKNGVYWRDEKLPVDVQSFKGDKWDPLCWWDKNEKYCRTSGKEPSRLFDTKGNVWK